MVAGKKKNITKNFTVETLGLFIQDNYPTATPNLNQVLTAGSTSLLSAEIQSLGLFDNGEGGYGLLTLSSNAFEATEASGNTIFNIDNASFKMFKTSGGPYANIFFTGVANRNYQLPDASGTIALTSDIPTKTSDLINDGEDGINPFITAADIPVGTQDLDSVLTIGNTSLLDANIGSLGVWDPSNLGYLKITGGDNSFIFKRSDLATILTVEDGLIALQAGSIVGSISTAALTLSRTYGLPDASGTIALTSDIPSLAGYVPYTGATQAVNLGAYNLTVNNISVGIGSGAVATNTAVGNNSLSSNTTGGGNSTLGASALRINSSGSANTAIGNSSLYSNTIGSANTAVGDSSLFSTTGFYNSALGTTSLAGNTTGSNNSAFGYEAGRYIADKTTSATILNNSVMLGWRTSPLANNQTNQIVIGYDAIGAGSNTVTLGNTSITTTRLRGDVQGGSFVKDGGTSLQYLMADGSVSTGPSLTGYVPTSRTLTINGTTYDLTADRTWSVGTVTDVTATSPITSSGGTTPVISTSMATNKLIGRSTAGTGVMEEITVGAGLTLSAGTLSATSTGGSIPHATASGTDTYTATISGITSYTDGEAFLIRFPNGNTTGCTLNINALGAIPLYRNNDGPLIGGDIWDGGEMLCTYNSTLSVFQCIGTSPNSLFAYITNADSVAITKGQPVYAFGGTGDRLTVKRAFNTSDATSAQTIGVVVTSSIATNQKGIIIVQGLLDGLNILPTATWSDGDSVYLGSTAGSITNVKQYAPNNLVYLGTVTTASNGSAGRWYVRIQNGYELDELHNVQAQSPTLKDTLWYDNTVSPAQWKTASISTILGYTPVTDARTISTTTPLQGGGDLTANRTLSILQSSAIQDGYLSSANWTTFNSKQDAITGAATTITTLDLTASRVLVSDASGKVAANAVTTTTLSYLDATSSIQTQLNAKQGTLTLTTTGTSGPATLIANTLNIPQYSGGGGSVFGVHAFIKPSSGRSVAANVVSNAFGTIGGTANRLHVYPFIPVQSITSASLYINVTALAAGSNAQIVIYSSLSDFPNTLIYSSANLDCSTTGVKTATTTQTFTAGTTYWIGLHSSSNPTYTGINNNSLIPAFNNGGTTVSSVYATTTFGTPPTTFPSSNIFQNTAVPLVGITI
jgi:hypothetical protein